MRIIVILQWDKEKEINQIKILKEIIKIKILETIPITILIIRQDIILIISQIIILRESTTVIDSIKIQVIFLTEIIKKPIPI